MTMTGGASGGRTEKLGYLGLGMMGFPRRPRLLNAGYDVSLWTRSAAKAKALVAAGADVLSISESHHSLEDVYLELVDTDEAARRK